MAIIRINRLRMGLAIGLLVLWLLLMDPHSFYGLVFHEWVGIGIVGLFLLHLAVDWKFIRTVSLGFFKHLPPRTRVNAILDVLLLAGVALVVVSGLPIARTLDFSWLGFDLSRGGMRYWRLLHISFALLVLLALGIHLGLHWQWVMARFRQRRGRS